MRLKSLLSRQLISDDDFIVSEQMAAEEFDDCSNHGECEAVCPKGISLDAIASMRREYIKAQF